MDIEKACIYGLLYLFLALWMASIVGDIYKSNLRHKEQIDANTKNYKENLEKTQVLAQALVDSRDSIREAIAALAMQKSLVLIASDDGDWKLVALDTGSKDKVREWLAQQREKVGDAQKVADVAQN
ncbi:hypothetical protein [uncultured Desulfovibrio sp.]|uniref:hypothetical protein n=1 Tax=uncultured Desulfovibrio sp. TaxID=167968 RepID=UPI002050BA37|nr:hypothetical protein [uncultured Desulfovibrio sp.]DAJ56736.1 MAG TPA: hypothetical protein [Caudoviricetes sp.]